MRKKSISIIVMILMVFSYVQPAIAESVSEHSELNTHWAEQTLNKWLDSGLLEGYPDGSIRPNQAITRAEFVRLVNSVFGFHKQAGELTFSDIVAGEWYAVQVAIAVQSGYIKGYPDGTFRPHQLVSRQEAAAILTRVFELPRASSDALASFADRAEAAAFARDAISRLVEAGVLNGLPERRIGPKEHLSRAEAVMLLDRLAERIIRQQGEYEGLQNAGNVMISEAGVTLRDSVIGGDLILSAGIGEGDVTLSRVTVEGTLWIQGGGQNSVYIHHSSIGRTVIDKQGSPVRVVVNGTVVSEFDIRTSSRLEIDEESEIEQMSIQSSADGSSIDAKGNIGNVNNDADDVKLNGNDLSKDTLVSVEDGEVRTDSSSEPSRPSSNRGSRGGSGNSGGGGSPGDEEEPGGETPTEDDWTLIWSDEFDGSGTNLDSNGLDLDNWGYQLGTGAEYGLDGWGNNEQQYYRAENIKVEDGKLIIEARNEGFGGKPYTSGRIWTSETFAKKYGKFEARMKLPQGDGFWPAFWMMPKDDRYGGWAASGELDIMEARGRLIDHVGGTIHYGKSWPNNKSTGDEYHFPEGESILDYHTYAVEWEPGEIRWYVDGNLYQTLNDWYSQGDGQPDKYAYPAPFDQEFYMILNLAVGGNYDGNREPSAEMFPATMEVDYVRVYELTGRDYREPVEPEVEIEPLPDDAKQAIDGNYVHDVRFEEPITDVTEGALNPNYWNFVHIPGTLGEGSVTIDELDGSRFANIHIDNGGTADYAVQLIQNVTLGKGRTYKVSFDAKSTANRTINVKLGGGEERGWAVYSDTLTASLNNELQHYEFTFQMLAETDVLARLEFNLGLNTNPVWIGNVKVEETEVLVDPNGAKAPLDDGNHVYNGTFDLGSMDRLTFWNTTVKDAEAELSVHPDTREFAALITNGGSEFDSIELKQLGINLLQNDEYVLTFDARANEPRSMEVQFVSEDGTVVYESKIFDLSEEMTAHSFGFTMPAGVTDERSQLALRLGSHDADVYLDNIRLIRTTDRNIDYSGVDFFPLKNGDFAFDYMFWEPFVQGGSANFTIDDGAAKISVANTGSEAWNIMLNQANLNFAKGFTYTFAFDVRSTAERDIEVTLENASYARKFETGSIAVGPTTERYEFTFKPTVDENLALKFLLGKTADSPAAAHDIIIDNVVLEVEDAPVSRPPALMADTTDNRFGQSADISFHDDADWRGAIRGVIVDDVELAVHLYEVLPGKIILAPESFATEGIFTITVKAEGYADTSVVQTMLPSDGNLIRNGDMTNGLSNWEYWVGAEDWSDLVHDSGAAKLDIHYHGGTGNEWSVPYSWSTQFIQEGVALDGGETYELSFRAWASVDRPIQLELGNYNGNEKTTYEITGDTSTVYKKTITPGSALNLDVRFLLGNVVEGVLTTPETPHTIYIDDVKLVESGVGVSPEPPESPDESELLAPPVLISDGSRAEIGQPLELTFADDEAWRSAVTDVLINDVSVTETVYEATFAPGLIVLEAGLFEAAMDYEIRVTADGYDDAVVVQAISEPSLPHTDLYLIGGSKTRALSFMTENSADKDVLPHDGTVITYMMDGVTGVYNGSGSAGGEFHLNGLAIGIGIHAKVNYDFEGDGSWDRTEESGLIATDGNTASEAYEQFMRNPLTLVSGDDYRDFADGTIKVEVYIAFGSGEAELKVNGTADSTTKVVVPYTLSE